MSRLMMAPVSDSQLPAPWTHGRLSHADMSQLWMSPFTPPWVLVRIKEEMLTTESEKSKVFSQSNKYHHYHL